MADLTILHEISIEEEDPDLFPEVVHGLFARGKKLEARERLLEFALHNMNAEQAAKQEAYAMTIGLWADGARPPALFSLNGFGLQLYGGKHYSDGTKRGVHWLTALWIPVIPLGAYRVVDAEEGGWYFLAHDSLPKLTLLAPLMWAFLALSVVCSMGVAALDNLGNADVYVYNGFDVPIEVSVGPKTDVLSPGNYQHFTVEAVEQTLSATTVDGRQVESITYDLTDHAYDTVVYNPRGRGLIRYGWIRYGPGEPEAPEWLPPLSVVPMDRVDHPFDEPPEEVQVTGIYEDRSVLMGMELPKGVAGYLTLSRLGLQEHADAMARVEAELGEDDGRLTLSAARSMEDPIAYVSDLRTRMPDRFGPHQAWAVLHPSDVVRSEYTAMLDVKPSPAVHAILAQQSTRTADARHHYEAAIELSPRFAPAHLGLAGLASDADDWDTAAKHYELYAAFGDPEVVVREQVRIARLRGEAPAPSWTADGSSLQLSDMLAVDADPSSLGRVQAAVQRRAADVSPQEQNWLKAELALIAGQLGQARQAMMRSDPGQVQLLQLRLALSDGTDPSDRVAGRRAIEALRPALPDMPRDAILAWGLLPPAERGAFAAEAITDDNVREALEAVVRDLKNPRKVDAHLAGTVDLEDRGAIYAVAAFLTPASNQAGVHYRAQARRFGLPPEIPYFRR